MKDAAYSKITDLQTSGAFSNQIGETSQTLRMQKQLQLNSNRDDSFHKNLRPNSETKILPHSEHQVILKPRQNRCHNSRSLPLELPQIKANHSNPATSTATQDTCKMPEKNTMLYRTPPQPAAWLPISAWMEHKGHAKGSLEEETVGKHDSCNASIHASTAMTMMMIKRSRTKNAKPSHQSRQNETNRDAGGCSSTEKAIQHTRRLKQDLRKRGKEFIRK